jgi:hypothetical protein
VWGSRASDVMGISAFAVCCRRALSACVGSDQGRGDTCQPIAIGRTVVAQRRSNDTMAIHAGVGASMVIAGREPAQQSPAILSHADLDHDVSILITAVDVGGR